eukprot:NODE_6534_length_257_cov_28.312500_g6451_i0.p1 GENE.NODE_6534_length_257_cov_28.312500_g6451_i0~~NODE_6534_length_257_cov_28.312500_g6451_i0.p1  ORF type:complete len:82 (+),score=18.33 NODE_6534_length_257_cov_28.312500_g6451_i0:31-246(+)
MGTVSGAQIGQREKLSAIDIAEIAHAYPHAKEGCPADKYSNCASYTQYCHNWEYPLVREGCATTCGCVDDK